MIRNIDQTLPRQRHDVSSTLIAFYLCLALAVAFIAASDQFLHWFIIPIILCGTVIGTDAVNWARGRLDTFDPFGIVGVYGLYFFFLSPLFHVLWGHQLLYLPRIEDWRPWLGYMAILNFFGLLFYQLSRSVFQPNPSRTTSEWRINNRALLPVLVYALGITAVLQILVYQQFGGIAGYIGNFEDSISSGTPVFVGLGTLFAISESFPLLLMIGYALLARHRPSLRAWFAIFLMLAIFFAVRILFGGLRGSRSNTIFAMIWALGVVHLYIRPIPRRLIYLGLVFAFGFIYLFGFYKAAGIEGLLAVQNPSALARLETITNRNLKVTLLSDIGRADIQAYILHELNTPWREYHYGYGISYLSGILAPIPSAIWANKPVSKVQLGTEALYGRGSYEYEQRRSSRVYGLAGEALLNFGPVGVPAAFVGLGLVVGLVRRRYLAWNAQDARRLLLPLLILLCLLVLSGDTDNNAIFLVKQGLVPFLVIWLGSKRGAIAES